MAFNNRFAERMAEKYGLELVQHGDDVGVWNEKLIDALVEDGKVLNTWDEVEDFGKIKRMCWLKGRAYVTGERGKVAAVLDNDFIRAIWNHEDPDE